MNTLDQIKKIIDIINQNSRHAIINEDGVYKLPYTFVGNFEILSNLRYNFYQINLVGNPSIVPINDTGQLQTPLLMTDGYSAAILEGLTAVCQRQLKDKFIKDENKKRDAYYNARVACTIKAALK